MGILKDAGEILFFVYKEYTTGNEQISSNNVIETTKWEKGRVNRAVRYLDDIGGIKMISQGNKPDEYHFIIRKVEPHGIHIIEDKSKFKKTFGFEVGVPGFKFSWGLTEK